MKKLVVKKFGASWCMPCKSLTPVFDKLKEEFPNVEFKDIDVDTDLEEVAYHQIKGVPTVVILNDSAVVGILNKVHPEETYRKVIEELSE